MEEALRRLGLRLRRLGLRLRRWPRQQLRRLIQVGHAAVQLEGQVRELSRQPPHPLVPQRWDVPVARGRQPWGSRHLSGVYGELTEERKSVWARRTQDRFPRVDDEVPHAGRRGADHRHELLIRTRTFQTRMRK